jgi:hypothetical protein
MDDSDARVGQSTSRGLSAFDKLLGVVNLLLALVTVLAVPLLALALTGHASMTVDANLTPPYTVDLAGARSVVVTPSWFEYKNFPIGDERSTLGDDGLNVHTKAKIGRDDIDSRIVVATALVVVLTLAWLGLVNLRRIVHSARAGDPFDLRNVNRLRRVAYVVFAVPVIAFVLTRVINHTLESDVPLRVTTPGINAWPYVIVGVGLLALAEVFREGTELRVLERATI